MDEDSEKTQFHVSSDTFAKTAGALAQTEGVVLCSPVVNAQILSPGVPRLIPNSGKSVFCIS